VRALDDLRVTSRRKSYSFATHDEWLRWTERGASLWFAWDAFERPFLRDMPAPR
jgi:hypothetical protein